MLRRNQEGGEPVLRIGRAPSPDARKPPRKGKDPGESG